MTKKEITELKRQLKAIKACNGDCQHCPEADLHSASEGRFIYFALGCKKAPALGAISERPSTMRNEIIEALEFELS